MRRLPGDNHKTEQPENSTTNNAINQRPPSSLTHRTTLCCKPGSANHPDLRVPRAATSWASCLFAADESNVGYLTF
ncbi:hypothetical protein C9411_19975 [Serratia sp. Nf2]|nr:hypothetical protein C9411_19975 [Serratia sp. Nf2]